MTTAIPTAAAQVGQLHSARYGWVTCYGTFGKSLERRRSCARDMLPAQVADAERAAERAHLHAGVDTAPAAS